MMHDYSGYGSSNDVGGYIFMFLVMTLIVIGIFLFIRFFGQGSRGNTGEDTALDVLKKRYAKGEIDKKEFNEKRKDLSD